MSQPDAPRPSLADQGHHRGIHTLATADPTAGVADEVVVRRALDQLKADDRIVLALRFYRDLKVDDVAGAMGIRPRAVSSRLHRALERLRRALDESDMMEVGR